MWSPPVHSPAAYRPLMGLYSVPLGPSTARSTFASASIYPQSQPQPQPHDGLMPLCIQLVGPNRPQELQKSEVPYLHAPQRVVDHRGDHRHPQGLLHGEAAGGEHRLTELISSAVARSTPSVRLQRALKYIRRDTCSDSNLLSECSHMHYTVK